MRVSQHQIKALAGSSNFEISAEMQSWIYGNGVGDLIIVAWDKGFGTDILSPNEEEQRSEDNERIIAEDQSINSYFYLVRFYFIFSLLCFIFFAFPLQYDRIRKSEICK